MATLVNLNQNILPRGSKNVDNKVQRISSKNLGKDAIPDDGGKRGQAKIEKELGLNKPNKTVKDKLLQDINKKNQHLTKGDQARDNGHLWIN